MAGHSKWATTKHKKAVVDARRGKLFAKLIKNIEVAARQGGGDPEGNPTLFDAIQKAKKSSVPNDNIDRAVKRGSGADGAGVGAATEQQPQGGHQHRLARAGLTGDHGQALAELQHGLVDHAQRADPQLLKHPSHPRSPRDGDVRQRPATP
jgi:hypothetical protein